MNYAETLVLKNKFKLRMNAFDDLRLKFFGKYKFESKASYCDQNIQNLLNYFNPSGTIEDENNYYKIRKQLWQNQSLLKKKGLKNS